MRKLTCNCRCDKNGDGKLSEDEVKEVSPNPMHSSSYSSSSTTSSMVVYKSVLQTCDGKGDIVECFCKQAIES